ncbi:MAG: hypothetical protein V4603_18720 [Pseudomonadota bacterium]
MNIRFNLLTRLLSVGLLCLGMLLGSASHAQPAAMLAGNWLINEDLSDNTDKQVERALRDAGERVKRSWFNRDKERYRGGPAEQELYDRFSYDLVLTISEQDNGYVFEYADNFRRSVYTDNRSRTISLTALDSMEDFSLGHWENGKFLVESHPRDGGHASETYTLLNGGARLQVEFIVSPNSFTEEIELKRVYDRQP